MADETTNSICGQSEGSHDGQLNESVNNEANGVQGGLTTGQISTVPAGYPSFSVFLASSARFQNFRRFRALRMRMLLLKQDKVVQLEQQLNKIDVDEKLTLFLGNNRRDRNKARNKVLEDLDYALAAYDQLLQRSQWVINMPSPTNESLKTVKNWLDNRGCIYQEESAFLNRGPLALLNIGYLKDASMVKITTAIAPMMAWYYRISQKGSSREEENFDVIRVPNPLIRAIARTLAAIFTIAVLLVPALLLNLVQTIALRFTIIFVAAGLFITAITAVSKATMSEMFIAGAAYAAVLVVFVASNGPTGVGSNTGG